MANAAIEQPGVAAAVEAPRHEKVDRLTATARTRPALKVAVAHPCDEAALGAARAGRSVAATMGLSALDGLPMGTRCGLLDVGVVFWMPREMGLAPDAAERLLDTRSGLLGVSGLSNDRRALRAQAEARRDARTGFNPRRDRQRCARSPRDARTGPERLGHPQPTRKR